jgi:hypothetical protein
LTLQQIQQPLRGISFFQRRSSCSLTGKASFSKGSGFSLVFARGLCTEASSGGARGSTVYGEVAVCTGGGLLARFALSGCEYGGWKTLRVSVSIYKLAGGSTTAGWICIGS